MFYDPVFYALRKNSLFYRKNNNAKERAKTKQNPANIATLSFSTQILINFQNKKNVENKRTN